MGTGRPSGFSHLLHFASVKGGAGASFPQPAWLSQLPTLRILRVPASPFRPSSPPHLRGQINCLKTRFDLILALLCIFSGSLYRPVVFSPAQHHFPFLQGTVPLSVRWFSRAVPTLALRSGLTQGWPTRGSIPSARSPLTGSEMNT